MSEKYCWGLMVLTIFCLFGIVPVIAETSTTYWAPWVTNTNTTSATINWRGESRGSGLIDYATLSYYNTHHSYEKTIASTDITSYQHVQLNGLEPNTSYIYLVRPSGNEDVFANRMFRTMPVSGPFTTLARSPQTMQRIAHLLQWVCYNDVILTCYPDRKILWHQDFFFGFEGITWSPIIIMSKPPALPGDSKSLTFPGVYQSLPFLNRSKFKKGGIRWTSFNI